MKKVITRIVIVILFLVGLSLLLYPLIANEWNTYRQSLLMSDYDDKLTQMQSENLISYEDEWAKAIEYNINLTPIILPDSFAIAEGRIEPDATYMGCLNLFGDGMMGQIEIPKIAVKLPIYHTTMPKVLEHAAGHLEGSSLPIGGESTHSVISAHRGLPSATLFTDLDKLEEGDYFFLYMLDETLVYQVDQISVVDPSDTSLLTVEDGKDYVTLLTCTPYGVNTERLLVRGTRTYLAEEEVVEVKKQEEEKKTGSIYTNYTLWVVVGISATVLFTVLLIAIDRIRTKKRKQKET